MSEEVADPRTITLHYLKSNSFRTLHCDGAIGAPSPNGRYLHISLFSERGPIPVEVTHAITDGMLGEPVANVSRSGVVREIEADVIMDIETVKAVAKWMLRTAQDVENLTKAAATSGKVAADE